LGQITTINPSTGEEITKFTTMDKNQVFDLVGKAKRAYPEWKKDYEKRRSYVYNLVEYLLKIKSNLQKLQHLKWENHSKNQLEKLRNVHGH